MLCIKELSEKIYEELDDAKWYAEKAIKYKDTDKQLGDTYIQISKEEMAHMNRLHDQITRVIYDYRNAKGEPPKEMMALYEYEHNQIIERAAQVQYIISMYK